MQANKNTTSRNDVNKVIAPVSTQNDPQLHNITEKPSMQPKPRDLTVSAQLNGKDIELLVDTDAGISVIDEQFLT